MCPPCASGRAGTEKVAAKILQRRPWGAPKQRHKMISPLCRDFLSHDSHCNTGSQFQVNSSCICKPDEVWAGDYSSDLFQIRGRNPRVTQMAYWLEISRGHLEPKVTVTCWFPSWYAYILPTCIPVDENDQRCGQNLPRARSPARAAARAHAAHAVLLATPRHGFMCRCKAERVVFRSDWKKETYCNIVYTKI